MSVEDCYKDLMAVRKALLSGRLYIGVSSVSKSGMSRTLVIKYIEKNELKSLHTFVYKLADCNADGRISGCGIDMCFAAQYDLFCYLCPDKRYQDSMPRYRDLF